MPKMILIAHNKHLHSTRCGANLTFHHFIQKVIDEGKSFYIYDPLAENQPRIEEVPEFFRTYFNGEIKDVPFYEAPEDVALLGKNIWWSCYDRYTGGEFERMVAEMKKISDEYNVDVVLWTKHYFIKNE